MASKKLETITLKELEYLKSSGRFQDELLEKAIPQAIINQARSDYQEMIETTSRHPDYSIPADHMGEEQGYPLGQEILAYALEQQAFSPEELRRIDFDDAKSPEGFIKKYRNPELIDNLRTKLLGQKDEGIYRPIYG